MEGQSIEKTSSENETEQLKKDFGSDYICFKIKRNRRKKQEDHKETPEKEKEKKNPSEEENNKSHKKSNAEDDYKDLKYSNNNNNPSSTSNESTNIQTQEPKISLDIETYKSFLQQNQNTKGSSVNTHKNSFKSGLKSKLKLKLDIKKPAIKLEEKPKSTDLPKNETSNTTNTVNNKFSNVNLNLSMNENEKVEKKIEDFIIGENDNININIDEEKKINKESLNSNNNKNNISISENINGNEKESSKILKEKFNQMYESQISFDGSTSFNFNGPKPKFKLSLYRLEKIKLIGAGSSGEVYLVQDISTHKKLAIKQVKYTGEETVKKQIENEVKLGTELKHENIIKIYATYFLNDTINFVMEYMNKGTLADLLKKVKRIPEKILGLITVQILKGLAYCQTKKRKIIHRDLKPSNILINSKGQIKISDFGVSTIVESSWAQRRTMVGTYIYMAPERIDAEDYSLNCDIWSLGIIVVECLYGFYPYKLANNGELPESVWKVRELIENYPLIPLNYGGEEGERCYSEEISGFVSKCLVKEHNKRPTATNLLEDPFIVKYNNLEAGKNELINWLMNIN